MVCTVSVIIPVYNIASYLEECLYSVQNQSYRDIEVIMINDGSTDGSEHILSRFQKNDTRFRLFNQENQGLGYTRNRGISLSSGRYVFFLDGDDILPKDAIQNLLSSAEACDADYAVGKVLRFNDERKYAPPRHVEFNLYVKKQVTTIEQSPELLQDSIACNKLWKKEFLINNNLTFTEGKYYEDLFFTMRAAVLAKKIAVTNKPVYYWRVRTEEHNRSITQEQMKLENTLHRLSALRQNRQWLIENHAPAKIIEQNDLKSLIDVLRLHVVKFALVDKNDRDEWQEQVIAFLREIPAEIAKQLAPKEKMLYELILNRDFYYLEQMSRVYMNIETTPVVKQKGQRFFVYIRNRMYDVTADFKPTMKVEAVQKRGRCLIVSGELTIPKASQKIEGHVYVANRASHEEISLGTLECEVKQNNDIYPYEHQTFRWILPLKEMAKLKKRNVYDVYYRINGDERIHRPSRVRLAPIAKNYQIRIGFKIMLFYRTDYGNLSIKFVDGIGFKSTIKKIGSLLNPRR
ncbi:glycosyltransferase family 2 protein [Geobacillus thermoleovorans]|uniref:glycosyltransferase family 2 protein n=1 Tax=Geobacillus thermoleovorans TaxID=33941 RepID=UPI00345C4967